MADKTGTKWGVGDKGDSYRLYLRYQFTATAIKIRPEAWLEGGSGTTRTVKISWKYNGHKVTKKKKIKFDKGVKNWVLSTWVSIPYYTAAVGVSVGSSGMSSSVSITSNLKPGAPNIRVNYVNDNRFNITVSSKARKGVRTGTVTLQRKTDAVSENWQDVHRYSPDTSGAYNLTWTDQSGPERGHRYMYRARANNGNGSSGWVTSTWGYTNAPDVSNVAHVRNTNYKNTVTFERAGQDVDRKLFTGFIIGRKTNKGTWTKIKEIGPGKSNVNTVSYKDTTCAPDNYYSYRIRPKNSRGSSPNVYDIGGTEPTYNTPAAPTKIVATLNSAGNGVLKLTNTPKTATQLIIQRSDDGGTTWTDLATLDETEAPVKSYTDTSGIVGSNVVYRARNAREDLPLADRYSKWTRSNVVSTLSPPSAPTLIMPVNNTPVELDNETVRLAWIHNPTDGTAETAAQVQISINGVYHSTVTLGAVAYYDLTLNPATYSANDVITWKVRTKGEDDDYSTWSDANTFTLLARPNITFTAPANGGTINQLPISLEWEYDDDSGLLESLTLDIIRDNTVEKTVEIPFEGGESGDYTYSLAEFLFENETEYQLQVTAVSSSGLSSTDLIDIYVSYIYVTFQNSLVPDAEFDEETGEAVITLNVNEADMSESEIVVDSPVANAYLYRVVNGQRVLLGGELQEGDQITDRFAPINVDVRYELLEVASTGELGLEAVSYMFESIYWYVMWGNDYSNLARAIYDPSGDVSLSRPEKEQVRYSGRKYPVTYDSTAIEETFNFSGVTDERDELNNFIRMIRDGGQGIWKSADGHCYMADFEFSYSSEYSQNHLRWAISLSVTRIDSEDL